MSFNLIDLVKDQLSEQVMGQLGNVLGGSASQNSSAISSALPGLLSGLIGSGSSNTGAEALLGAVSNSDDSILDNLGDLLGGSGQSSLMSAGSNILGSLLGGSGSGGIGNLIGAVAGFSGAGKGPIKSMLGLLAPIIFGVVKRKLLGNGGGGLNIGSLMGMLNGQKDNVAAALPTGFSQHLTAGDAVQNVQQQAKEGKSFLGRLLPIAVIAGALFFAYNTFFKGSVDNAVDSATSAVSGMDLGGDVTNVMGSLTSSLGGITDVASAEEALPKLTEATTKLGSLAGMLDKLPEAARGPIMGIVSSALPQIQGLLDKVSAIPGVGPIITPMAEKLLANLALFK